MSHLLNDIDIKDFKCFKDFKANGFKRVNLISGKNNVGKTAFMEACWVNTHSLDIKSATYVIENIGFARNNLEYIKSGYTKNHKIENIEKNNLTINSNVNDIEFKVLNESGIKSYSFKIKDLKKEINTNTFSYSTQKHENSLYIDNYGLTKENLKEIFIPVQQKDKEDSLYEYISDFDDNIVSFKVLGGEKPSCKVKDRNEYQDINEFGDGLKHYISIICALYACENGYLFIDEIDNGIHYTQLNKLWQIILNISKEQNIQVFATTHSKEMIESYARVSKKLEDKDISFIELGRDKENKIQANVLNFEKFQKEIDAGNGVRGW